MSQREIKFRAWDKKTGTMFDLGYLADCLYTQNFAEEYGDDLTKYIIMQFTGLKDKNGKEIYEGDIMKIGSGDPEGNEYVGFYNGQFILKEKGFEERMEYLEKKYKDNEFMMFQAIHSQTGVSQNLHLEVIGNIYENPDLLK